MSEEQATKDLSGLKTSFNFNENQEEVSKYSSAEQIDDLSEACAISKSKIKEILFLYRCQAINELLNRNEFRFGIIAKISIKGDDPADYEKPLAFYAYRISEDSNIPYRSALGVLNTYMTLTVNHLMDGSKYNLVGILNLKPVLDEWGHVVNFTVELSRNLSSFVEPKDYKLRAKILNNTRYYVTHAENG